MVSFATSSKTCGKIETLGEVRPNPTNALIDARKRRDTFGWGRKTL